MADYTITATQVLLTSGTPLYGVAGATITQGQSVYLDTSANTWKLAQADGTAAEAGSGGTTVSGVVGTVGIALQSVSSGQRIEVAGPGCVVQMGAGAAIPAGKVIVVSATAGGVAPVADIVTTGYYVTILGEGIGSTSIRMICHYPAAALP